MTYTQRFFALQLPAAERSIAWTVPAGYTWILRDLCFYNGVGASRFLSLSVQIAPGLNIPLVSSELGQYATGHADLRQELKPGEQVVFDAAAVGFATALGTGYAFLLG